LLDKIDEISRAIKPTDTYIAPSIQQATEWIDREVSVYNPQTFYHNGITHIRSIIKTTKKIHKVDNKTGEITDRTIIQFSVANFRENAQFFHDKILDHWKVETMHQYKDKSLLEDAHNAHLNPFLMTIIRSFTLNILHLNGVKSIQNQLVKNRWNLDSPIKQLLNFSF
jgi:translation initiation factor 2 gamma subunit (eIF-2gamma)